MPKAVVLQSYKTSNVPQWMEACMQSVRAWAKASGYEYQFLGDEFLDYAPQWYRDKSESILPVTDLARLLLIKEQLESYDEAIWIDTDVLVFDQKNFNPQLKKYSSFAFCYEIWTNSPKDGQPIFSKRVNNAVCMFNKDSTELDFFIKSAIIIMKKLKKAGPWDVGVNFLTHANNTKYFQLLNNVGMISPAIMNDIVHEKRTYLPYFGKLLPAPLAAANLCGSHANQADDFDTGTQTYETVVKQLLASGGSIINNYRF